MQFSSSSFLQASTSRSIVLDPITYLGQREMPGRFVRIAEMVFSLLPDVIGGEPRGDTVLSISACIGIMRRSSATFLVQTLGIAAGIALSIATELRRPVTVGSAHYDTKNQRNLALLSFRTGCARLRISVALPHWLGIVLRRSSRHYQVSVLPPAWQGRFLGCTLRTWYKCTRTVTWSA